MLKRLLTLAVAAVVAMPALAKDQTVNIYSYRQAFLIEPILAKFTEQTGIKTQVIFAKSGLIERLQREGKFSPADVVLTSAFDDLLQLQQQGLTQPIVSDTVSAAVPAQFRDPNGDWVALTKRVRGIYSAKDRVANSQALSYEDLTKPEFKGKVCTRSGKHPYNIGLISSMIYYHGEAQAKAWLEGVKANLARHPQGNDRQQVQAIKEGLCDVSLGNSYYYGAMMQDEEQRPWAEAVNFNFPNQANRGAHINVSGIVLAKHAPNKDGAVKLVEFMVSEQAQSMYAEVNMEYPVRAGVALSKEVASWGKFKEDQVSLTDITKHRATAVKLVDEVKFDL